MCLSSFAGRACLASSILAVVVLCGTVVSAQQPTLAEVAKKEQERRKTTKAPTKVLTNKDLPTVTKPAPADGADSGAAGARSVLESVKAAEQEKADRDGEGEAPAEQKDEAWWRARLDQPREMLRRNEVFLEALQTRVNALSADYASRDDPNQRARVGDDRQRALAEMERLKADIELLKKQIADIEEDARKASVPPGWLR